MIRCASVREICLLSQQTIQTLSKEMSHYMKCHSGLTVCHNTRLGVDSNIKGYWNNIFVVVFLIFTNAFEYVLTDNMSEYDKEVTQASTHGTTWTRPQTNPWYREEEARETVKQRCMRGSGGGGPDIPPLENHKAVGFRINTGPDPMENHKATKQEYNAGPPSVRQRNAISIAFRWWADDDPLFSVFWILSPLVN